MAKQEIILDGNRFANLEEFYLEADRILTKNLDWKTGHNLNAFNDLLRGGFGVFEYDEPIRLLWINSQRSENLLGFEATIEHYTKILKTCQPDHQAYIKAKLKGAEQKQGQTLFGILVEIIEQHDHIEFELR